MMRYLTSKLDDGSFCLACITPCGDSYSVVEKAPDLYHYQITPFARPEAVQVFMDHRSIPAQYQMIFTVLQGQLHEQKRVFGWVAVDDEEPLTENEHDRIYNRLREHEAGEHKFPSLGIPFRDCPDCEGWGQEARKQLGEA